LRRCGASETIVGRWLARQPRDRILVATKVAGPARNLHWIRNGPPAMDRDNIRAAVDGSLRRLQTDYIDLYQLHWPERNQPMFGQWQYEPDQERDGTSIREQLETLGELVRAGKVRHVGVSNEHPWGIMQFVRLADELGLPRIVSTQNAYSLLNRSFETGLAETRHPGVRLSHFGGQKRCFLQCAPNQDLRPGMDRRRSYESNEPKNVKF
jgi:aryl-alcohol dehydrogenase-like predicted oxidoreductase